MRARAGWAPSIVGLATTAALLVAGLPPPSGAAPSGWRLPVDGSIVRPFRAPVGAYGSGHRGVDLTAAPGTSVRAANDGVVVFAGPVAGSLHVVVAHDGGIRTSSSFLARVDVRVGQRVARGTVLGAAGGAGDGHGVGVVHFGVRVGDRYVDPMLLFGTVDLTEIVRLVPVGADAVAGATTTAAERAAIAEEFLEEWRDEGCAGALGEIGFLGIGDGLNGACGALTAMVEGGLDGLRWIGGQAAAVAEAIGETMVAISRRIIEAGETILDAAAFVTGLASEALGAVVDAFKAIVRAGASFLEWLTSCPQPEARRHGAGSGNLALAVAGLGSSRRRRDDGSMASSMHVDHEVLGYRKREVAYFSYDPDAPTYSGRDTYGDLHAQARSLGKQLRALAAEHPGRAVDLLGHSQGGVVIALFLSEYYLGHEDEYPRIPNVVTFASPLEGTPLATLASTVDGSMPGSLATRAAKEAGLDLPLGTIALSQLDERSTTIDGLRGTSFEDGPRFLSIMGTQDLVVPSTSGDVEGAHKVVVHVGDVPNPLDDHSGILRDDDALSAAQAQLAGGSPAGCGPLKDASAAVYAEAVRLGTSAVPRTTAVRPTVPVIP